MGYILLCNQKLQIICIIRFWFVYKKEENIENIIRFHNIFKFSFEAILKLNIGKHVFLLNTFHAALTYFKLISWPIGILTEIHLRHTHAGQRLCAGAHACMHTSRSTHECTITLHITHAKTNLTENIWRSKVIHNRLQPLWRNTSYSCIGNRSTAHIFASVPLDRCLDKHDQPQYGFTRMHAHTSSTR